ncbi:MAG: YeiH family protein, partial [Pseudoalteromonas sp.]
VLISFGTAICGGSAIAAMAPVIKAKDHEVAVALGIVFLLNGVGLLLFPSIGHYLELSQEQFGMWAALAIHDTSSVVGASATYGAAALSIATTVKLTRAMWIIPYTSLAGMFWRSDEKASIPLFIVGFLAAALINTYLPDYHVVWGVFNVLAKELLVMTLFLIGSGLSLHVLKNAGIKPFIMAILLWIVVSSVILLLILDGFI